MRRALRRATLVLVLVASTGALGRADDSGDEDVRVCVANLLYSYGDERVAEARALVVALGARAVPRLTEVLSSGRAPDMVKAADALGAIGPEAAGAAAALRENLKDSDPPVRRASLEALGRVLPVGGALPAAIERLDDPSTLVGRAALGVLVRQGAAAADVVAQRLLSHEDREPTRGAIRRLGDDEAVPLLLALLDSASWHVRRAVLTLRWRSTGAGDAWLDRLQALALEDESSAVRREAAASLAARMPEDGPVRVGKRLEALLSRGDEAVRRLAVGGFSWASRLSAEAEHLLRGELGGVDPTTQAYAALALRAVHPDSRETIAALRARLDDHEPTVRLAAATSLVALGGRDPKLAETLASLLESWTLEPPYPARYEGRDLGSAARRPFRPLEPFAEDALHELGAVAHAAVTRLLDHEDAAVRRNAIHLLGHEPTASREVLEARLGSGPKDDPDAVACVLVHAGLESAVALDRLLRHAAAYADPEPVPDPVITNDLDWPATAVAVFEEAGARLLPSLFARARHLVSVDPEIADGLRRGLEAIVLRIGEEAAPHLEALRDDPTLGPWAKETLERLSAAD